MLRWCAVTTSHPGGSMPVAVVVWLWVDSDGIDLCMCNENPMRDKTNRIYI